MGRGKGEGEKRGVVLSDSKLSEKERAAQMKVLRRELARDLEEDLAEVLKSAPSFVAPSTECGTKDLSPKRVLEALLFASGKPMTMAEIRKIVGAGLPRLDEGPGDRAPTNKEIENWIAELKDEYNREGRSFELIEIAGGYEIATRREYAQWLGRLELEKKNRQASRSALETLAILAYKQPVTRAEIEELRGVDISGVLSTLLERGYIKIVGKKEVAGRPFLYGTTERFLEHFGLRSTKDLPPIGEIKSLVDRAVRREEIIKETTPSPQPSPPVGEREGRGVDV